MNMLMNMLNTVDKTSTTDRLDVKNEQKGRDLQRYSWQKDNIEGYWLDMIKRKGCSWFIKVWEGHCMILDFLRRDQSGLKRSASLIVDVIVEKPTD